MRVVIFGLGYVGCTAAGCIASQGHQVIGIDVSQTKVDAINAGRSPIHEPGLGELIAEARAAGLIEARLAIGDALEGADIAIVCVGTPSGVDGAHNMGFIAQVTRDIAASVDPKRAGPLTVAYRSTMRPGTTEQLIRPIFRTALGEAADRVIELVYNPEFLREASAIADYFAPPKIVIGTLDGRASTAMDRLHEGIEAPTFHVGMREAEVTKFVDNTKPFRSFAQETTALLALTAGDSAAARDEAQRLVRRRPMPAEHLFALGLAEMRSGHPQAFVSSRSGSRVLPRGFHTRLAFFSAAGGCGPGGLGERRRQRRGEPGSRAMGGRQRQCAAVGPYEEPAHRARRCRGVRRAACADARVVGEFSRRITRLGRAADRIAHRARRAARWGAVQLLGANSVSTEFGRPRTFDARTGARLHAGCRLEKQRCHQFETFRWRVSSWP